MAEKVFSAAGVKSFEIDLTGRKRQAVLPTGNSAGVLGSAKRGPAFVPITVANFDQFKSVFGDLDIEDGDLQSKIYGPYAMYQWLKNDGINAGTFMRLLGAGDGKKRSSSNGSVNNAGFVVGAEQVQNDGSVGANPYANASGDPGRTYFLGALMRDASNSTYLQDAGIQTNTKASAIIRGVLLAPSGVIMTLSGNLGASGYSDAPSTTAIGSVTEALKGASTGSVKMFESTSTSTERVDKVKLLLNGHKGTVDYPNSVEFSLNPESTEYISSKLNKDPSKIEQAGHLLYSHFPISPSLATITGSGILTEGASDVPFGGLYNDAAFILSGSHTRNTYAANVAPNYEGFEDRFQTPHTPYITSQKYGSKVYNLFRFYGLDDGAYVNNRIKISIANITPSNGTDYGTFTVQVRRFDGADDGEGAVVEEFTNCSLDPMSENYIGSVIGDEHFYYNFDTSEKNQKIVQEGEFPVQSNFIRVKIHEDVSDGLVPKDALPFGNRGYWHLVTSGSDNLEQPKVDATALDFREEYLAAQTAPIPFRKDIVLEYETQTSRAKASSQFYWGPQFDTEYITPQNSNKDRTGGSVEDDLKQKNSLIANHTKYFPKYATLGQAAWAGDNEGTAFSTRYGNLDADVFQNGAFSLNNIQVYTGSTRNGDDAYRNGLNPTPSATAEGFANPTPFGWGLAEYVRNGVITEDTSALTRAFKVSDLNLQANRAFAKFSVFLQGGFDGVNIFDLEKKNMTNTAAHREMSETAQGQLSGPTVAGYLKGVKIFGEKTDADVHLFAIPGISQKDITDRAMNQIEDRFDALYIVDPEIMDQNGAVFTGSLDVEADNKQISIVETVKRFKNRSLDTSFAAAYFPPVKATLDEASGTSGTAIDAPASAAVLGAFGANDSIAHPWFAPAGFSRGALGNETNDLSIQLNEDNVGSLYDAKINPIITNQTTNAAESVVVFGQKTLQVKQNSLDRVNVRRLLIEIRRRVKRVANTIIFEPNRAQTLSNFNQLVQPILAQIKKDRGVSNFRVVIDSSTTTQADIENNTIRGKIFIQPTKSVEFISLDFELNNSGAEI